MKIVSLTHDLIYHDERPTLKVLLDTEFGKEIRIAFKKNQVMRKHTAPFPIVVEVFEGAIDFGVNGEIQHLEEGDLIALEANVPHELRAIKSSIVRLSLNKADSIVRVSDVVQ